MLDPPRPIQRKELNYRKRRYVAVRYRGGRIELYRVARNSPEMFMRYANAARGGLDELAVERLRDELGGDEEAAGALLLLDAFGDPRVRNVQITGGFDGRGGVRAEVLNAHGAWIERWAPARLYQRFDWTGPSG
jgi:hypothetical protein